MNNPDENWEKISWNLAGEIDSRFIIYAPVDEVARRPITCYRMYDQRDPSSPSYMIITTNENEFEVGESMIHRHIMVLKKAKGRSRHIPELVISGTVPSLCYVQKGGVQEEPFPDITNRSICIFSHFAHPLGELKAFTEKGFFPTLVALAIGQGMVRALAALHNLGFVHREVSPYTLGYKTPISFNRLQHDLMVIDFGSVLPFPSEPRRYATFVGTLRYSSPNSHHDKELGPADDIISVIYVVAELIYGKLPWRSIYMKEAIKEAKEKFTRSICFFHLPREIRALYLEMLGTLNTSTLNYPSILNTIQKAMIRYSYQSTNLPIFMK
ncbi:unnamed protein product [Bursaphelenchus okinawaensis]|uniref:Protein kinase domain-containing protein n=1 Tax=Bursaphelenchus okinawaensis TaxID=465554 RepID=A0A811LNW4_9BILA|nr:unnamed protein product [Bursaphelenchus okinawaensis]CAG9126680.1 unnamed protein product [Bursaphelenchus okinawaensis]